MSSHARRLEFSEIDAAIQGLGQAFYNDPGVVLLAQSDLDARLRFAEWFCRWSINIGLLYGHVYTLSEPSQGAAIWIPPGKVPIGWMDLFQAGLHTLPKQFGLRTTAQFLRLMHWDQKVHDVSIQGPHWYLLVLGVEPSSQRQGFGSELMASILAQSNQDGFPCYVETYAESTLPFYQHHGFELVTEASFSADLEIWATKRTPNS